MKGLLHITLLLLPQCYFMYEIHNPFYYLRFNEEIITIKVNNYRNMLMGQGAKLEKPVDQWGRPR